MAESTPAVDFTLRDVRCGVGVDGSSFVYLSPRAGSSAIDALQRRLYSRTLESREARDAEYMPHVTIGVAADDRAADRIARVFQSRWKPSAGRIDWPARGSMGWSPARVGSARAEVGRLAAHAPMFGSA